MNHSTNNLHITHIASGDLWAGAEVQLFTLCKTLNQINDMKVSVILLNHGTLENKLREAGVFVKVIDESKANSLQIFFRLIKIIKRLKPNVIHTHRIKENILGSIAAKLAHNVPSIRSVHGAPEHPPSIRKPHKYLLYLLDWLSARYLQEKIIAVSADLQTILNKRYPQDKIDVVENGVDIDSLAPYREHKLLANSNRPNSFKIGLVGRLVPVKRVDIFIKIAKFIRDSKPNLDIQFHIYGDGPLCDELKQLSDRLSVNDIVIFEGHCENIHTQIASLDALLITSDHEGLPMTLLEAMALRTPIVAHSVGGITTTCKNGECCWLVHENSAEELANTLLACLDDREKRSAIASQAQSHIEHHYSAHANANSLVLAYKSLEK